MTEDLRALFVEEAAEQLTDFQAGVLRLEDTPGDAEAVGVVFRIAHSLKGSSAMMRFTEITRFTHVLESLLDQIRKGTRSVTPEVIDVLLVSGDALRTLVGRVATGPDSTSPEPDEAVESVRATIVALVGGRDAADRVEAMPACADAPTLYRIDFRPSPEVLRRGQDPLRVIEQLAELGELREVTPHLAALPPLAEITPEQCYLAWTMTLLTTEAPEELEACLSFAAEPDGLHIIRLLGTEAAAPARSEPRRRAHDRDEATVIRVAVDKVDRLVNLVGELVTTQSMLAQALTDRSPDAFAKIEEAVALMDRHTRDLHHSILGVRMVSVKTLFARFPRFVRDLAQALGKQAVVELSGEETELDKSVIEKIGDPLLHLVRNTIDHGLELPADRRAAGKAETGQLRLLAYQRGGNVYIEVSDDGRGLDRDRIVTRARAQGLVTPVRTRATKRCSRSSSTPASPPRARSARYPGVGWGWTWSSGTSRLWGRASPSGPRRAGAPASASSCP
jgi:two-component system chemotaxis sensor kinase CheA